jgi:hypothetical protein
MLLAAEDGQDDPQHPDRAQLDEAMRNQSVSEKKTGPGCFFAKLS